MGTAAQERLRQFAKDRVDSGKRIVFWLMAAPSAFAWYEAFLQDCRTDTEFAAIVSQSEFFQFDDYPIGRSDPKFPVTFRHLLETQLFDQLGDALPPEDHIHRLELNGDGNDAAVLRDYEQKLLYRLNDLGTTVIQVKGIGMDGHWGFHGRETPLDAAPGYISVPINRQNRIQQTLDWPEYFPSVESVPYSAATATVNLFLMADHIIDLVPQPSKRFSVLATYGTNEPIGSIPASALKSHGSSWSFMTRAAAESLISYRRTGSLRDTDVAAIDAIWGADQESRDWARSVLVGAGIMAE
jgi:6-phosphogluconolactonase/glucosamine-6-phosphate isomerase/deaminase